MKKRMAVWLYGGIGTGHFSQGYQPLEKLLKGLSDSFEIVIYSQSTINPDYQSSDFVMRSPAAKTKLGLIRWLYLILHFVKDHRRKKFELCFAFWGYPAGFLLTFVSKMLGLPCAVYLLGSDSAGIASINFGIFHKRVPRRLALWAYQRASILLAISEFQKQQLVKHGVKNNITVIPWGVEKYFCESISKQRAPALRCIHVGHLTPVKDQVTLLKAFALIAKQHPAELKIFGVDCLQGKIQNEAKELGLEHHVHFFDMIPYHEMPTQYAWADIMLHTSLFEGQCMALTEAAACSVLLAGTKVGLMFDLGDDGALTVEFGDFEGLATKVLTIINNPKAWDQKVQRAKSWSDAHKLSWTVDKVKSMLNALSIQSLKQ